MEQPAERVLIVDDDESLLEVCEVALRQAGYEVAVEGSGSRGLKRVEQEAFDLVLTDLQMPGDVDGHGVVLGVKARRPGTEVVVMTGAPTLKTAIATLKDGAYDYIIKPFSVDHLKAVVRRCLDHHRLRRDLAGERALRQELETAYKELQKVEELKESFLARLSHELRTPLTEMLMALSLMESKPEGKYLDIAKTGAKRLERTLSDLLAFVDLQKPQAPELKRPVDLEALLRGTVERLRPFWEPRRLEVALRFEPGLPAVSGDPALLEKAFEHLVHNAVVFNRQGGSVQVSGRAVHDRVEVSVADTGEGIPAEQFDQVFDSFYQIANYMTRKVDGLGLGLAITRRIVEAHGGEIGVSSKLGEGSVFRVRLPPASPA